METVDRDRVLRAVYPVLLERKAAGTPADALGRALAAAAEGYPFPTNLDLDQPVGGMTPASQAELAADALASAVAGRGPRRRARRLRRTPRDVVTSGLLDDKVLLVSGGTQGMGGAVARAAVDEGATVVVSGRREDVGRSFAAELSERGGREAVFVAADVGDVAQARGSVDEVVAGSAGSTAW